MIFKVIQAERELMDQYLSLRASKKVHLRDLFRYANVRETLKKCKECPRYNQSWACPSGTPTIFAYGNRFEHATILVFRVDYPEELVVSSMDRKELLAEREKFYDARRRMIQLTLLEAEKKAPGTLSVSTCLLCPTCARAEGKPCRDPEDRRYSMTSLGLDFTKLLTDLFDIKLNWSCDGLTKFDYCVAALLEPNTTLKGRRTV